jgi:hypothetical protein
MILLKFHKNNPWQRTVNLLDSHTIHTWVKKSKATKQLVLQAHEDDAVGGGGFIAQFGGETATHNVMRCKSAWSKDFAIEKPSLSGKANNRAGQWPIQNYDDTTFNFWNATL